MSRSLFSALLISLSIHFILVSMNTRLSLRMREVNRVKACPYLCMRCTFMWPCIKIKSFWPVPSTFHKESPHLLIMLMLLAEMLRSKFDALQYMHCPLAIAYSFPDSFTSCCLFLCLMQMHAMIVFHSHCHVWVQGSVPFRTNRKKCLKKATNPPPPPIMLISHMAKMHKIAWTLLLLSSARCF